MNWNLRLDDYLGSSIVGQVTTPIKIKRMSYEDSELNYFPNEGLCVAFINKDFSRKLNLRNPLVEVYPIHSGDEDLSPLFSFQKRRMLRFMQERLSRLMPNKRYRPTEPATFLLEETSRLITTSHYDPLTGERVITECIEAPNGWFKEEMVPDFTDVVDAILKSVLYLDPRSIIKHIKNSLK